MASILIPIVCMVLGVAAGALFVGTRQKRQQPSDGEGDTPSMQRPWFTMLLESPKKVSGYLRSFLIEMLQSLQERLTKRPKHQAEMPAPKPASPARVGVAQGRETLRKCIERVNRPAPEEEPVKLHTNVDLNTLNARTRIGREPKGETWQSVLIIDLCGSIIGPEEGLEVALHVGLTDVTDDKTDPMPALTRPKQGSIHSAQPFVYQTSMGKLCSQITTLSDWTAVAQISPEWFVLPRQGHRQLQYTISVVSQSTGNPLANATCVASFESIETGYLDIEDNIQRAKTLAVGLAFSVGAANHALLEPEIDVIHSWVRTNFGSADASESAQLELERALRKTATFFLRGGHLNLQQICSEIVEIAPMVGRLDILDLCLRVAAAKGQVTTAELTLLKDLADWLQIERSRLRAMVEKTLPIAMHQTHDAEMILGVTDEMTKDEARHQLNREYAKWSSRVISSDPAIRKQADEMLNLIANARTQYVGVKLSNH